jgi:hypothetical protein
MRPRVSCASTIPPALAWLRTWRPICPPLAAIHGRPEPRSPSVSPIRSQHPRRPQPRPRVIRRPRTFPGILPGECNRRAPASREQKQRPKPNPLPRRRRPLRPYLRGQRSRNLKNRKAGTATLKFGGVRERADQLCRERISSAASARPASHLRANANGSARPAHPALPLQAPRHLHFVTTGVATAASRPPGIVRQAGTTHRQRLHRRRGGDPASFS